MRGTSVAMPVTFSLPHSSSSTLVCPGVYNESLTIDKSITICGYGSMEHSVIRSTENVVVCPRTYPLLGLHVSLK